MQLLLLDDLTLGEIERFEDYTELSVADVDRYNFGREGDDDKPNPPAKIFTALVWLSGARDNPDFSIDDARAVKMADIEADGPDASGAPESESKARPRKESARARPTSGGS